MWKCVVYVGDQELYSATGETAVEAGAAVLQKVEGPQDGLTWQFVNVLSPRRWSPPPSFEGTYREKWAKDGGKS